jgi:hypothetical protein
MSESERIARSRLRDSELEVLLDAIPEPVPSAALRRAVAEIPLRHPQHSPAAAPWLLRTVWRAVLSAALVTAVGVFAGAWTADMEEGEGGWSALSSLTLAMPLDEELVP